MEKSKRKEMEFQLRRAEILSEAEKIFASKGFHDATMAEIADASGFAIGTLYHFFDGKKNLYATMINEKLEKMYSEIRESVNREDIIINKIKKLVESQFNFVEKNVDFCDLIIRGEGMTVSDGGTTLSERLIANYFKHIAFVADIMRLGMDAKTIKTDNPQMMAYSLLGIIRAFTHYWLFTEQDTLLSDKVDCVTDIFLKGVMLEVT